MIGIIAIAVAVAVAVAVSIAVVLVMIVIAYNNSIFAIAVVPQTNIDQYLDIGVFY